MFIGGLAGREHDSQEDRREKAKERLWDRGEAQHSGELLQSSDVKENIDRDGAGYAITRWAAETAPGRKGGVVRLRRNAEIGMAMVVMGALALRAEGTFVSELMLPSDLEGAELVCKVKVGGVRQSKAYDPNKSDLNGAPEYEATCEVLADIKGKAGQQITITVVEGLVLNLPKVEAGKVLVVFLRKGTDHLVMGAIEASAQKIEPAYGDQPRDRLLAELVAAAESKEMAICLPAVRHIGMLRDKRAAKPVAAAAEDRDAKLAREGVIAQYRMKIAPDVKKVMEVFDQQVLDVWYEESGTPQKDEKGKDIFLREGGHSFWQRGVPDFDYATFVREGIKHEWVRKDKHTLYLFFGVPWKVQRKACVPEFAALLEDKDERIRAWAVVCLEHTVNDSDAYERQGNADEFVEQWRKWWKEKGKAYMEAKAERK